MSERDRQAIRQLGRDWAEAVQHKDIDRLLDLVTDDVVFMPANAPSLVGRSALGQTYRAFLAGFEVHQTFAPEEIQVGGDCGVRSRNGHARNEAAGGRRTRGGQRSRHLDRWCRNR